MSPEIKFHNIFASLHTSASTGFFFLKFEPSLIKQTMLKQISAE